MKNKVIEWKMLGDSSVNVKLVSLQNVQKIYNFLKSKSNLKQKQQPRYSFLQLSKATGIGRDQVRYYCFLMAFKRNPIVRIRRTKYVDKKGNVKCPNKVFLVRYI